MSHILHLSPPFHDLTKIINVDSKVGPDEENNSTEVRTVQKLLQMAGRNRKTEIDVPNETGKFDAATGFWIYHIQKAAKEAHPAQIIDGVVSPARGSVYGSGAVWTIVMFNLFAKRHDPLGYDLFIDSFDPTL